MKYSSYCRAGINEGNRYPLFSPMMIEANMPSGIWEKIWEAQGPEVKALTGISSLDTEPECSLV